jgi:hypothetical protein
VERVGNTPILTYPNVVFSEENQPIAQNPIKTNPKAISAQPSEITPSKSSSKKIADGEYYRGSGGGVGHPYLEVKGNQYRIVCTDCGRNLVYPWKPLSELKYVREGVVNDGTLSKNETPYWCSAKARGWVEYKPGDRRRVGNCKSNGWEFKYL